MEVQQLEAVLHAALFQLFERAQDSRVTVRPNFERIAARILPSAAGLGGQLDAHADVGPHAHLVGIFEDQPQLGVLLDDRNDAAADLLREHRHLDELGILEAVADDRRIVRGQGHDGQQLGLAAGLEPEMIWPAEVRAPLRPLAAAGSP